MKTQEKIVQALLELLETQSIDSITIDRLCKHAHVSRVTFYHYFGDFPSIFTHLVFSKFLTNELNPYSHMEEGFTAATRFILKHRTLFTQLVNSKKHLEFFEFVKLQGYKHQLRWLDKYDTQNIIPEEVRTRMAKFYATGFTELFFDWIKHDYQPNEEIFKKTSMLFLKGYIEVAIHNFDYYAKHHLIPSKSIYPIEYK
jgi:AcrR family transcriptional regulator